MSAPDGARAVLGGVSAGRLRRALVTTECALAIVLMTGAGLLVRSWQNLTRVHPGFRPEHVLSMQLSTTAFETPAQRVAFYESVLEEVRSLAGVESTGIIGDLFVSSDTERVVTVDGHAEMVPDRVRVRVDEVSAELFTTLGTPLVSGRFFSEKDGPRAPRVVIINEMMSRRFWPGGDPVGSRFKFGPPDSADPWVTVVGVVGDMRRQGLENEPDAQVFEPLAQNPSGLETLLVRTSLNDPLSTAPAIRAAVGRLEERAPLYGVTTLVDRLDAGRAQRRFQTSLLLAFAVVALLMAAIGLYGLIHYSVVTRTQEIGLRMALGAREGTIFRMVVREGLLLTVTGLGIGLTGASWIGQVGSSLLFGVTPEDPLTVVSMCLWLVAVAAAACYFPARRAMKLDPTVALRWA